MKSIAVLVALLLVVGSASGYYQENPTLSACKTYLGLDIKVAGQQVYIRDCYALMEPAVDIPTLATMGIPVDAVMTAKVPRLSRFYPMTREDGSKHAFTARVLSQDETTRTIEYHLKELGTWSFVLDSDIGPDFVVFNLMGVQTSMEGASSYMPTAYTSGNSGKPVIDLRFANNDGGYGDGDIITFQGADVSNPNIRIQYGSFDGLLPSDGLTVDAKFRSFRVYDLTGAKQELPSFGIPLAPGLSERLKKFGWGKVIIILGSFGFLGVMGIIFIRMRRRRGVSGY